jgi:hypothetical protein
MFGGILQHFLSEPLKGGQIAVAKIFVDLGTGEGSQQGGGPAENVGKGWREETAPEELAGRGGGSTEVQPEKKTFMKTKEILHLSMESTTAMARPT